MPKIKFYTVGLNAVLKRQNWIRGISFYSSPSNDSDVLQTKKETSSTLFPTIKNKEIEKSESHRFFTLGPSCLCFRTQFDEAGVAVWLVLLLLEAAFAQGLLAEVTQKMVGMEFGPHGSDAAAQDWLLAGLTHAPTGLVVVGLTQRFTLMFKKAAIYKGSVAFLEIKSSEIQSQQRALTHGTIIRQLSCEMTTFSWHNSN